MKTFLLILALYIHTTTDIYAQQDSISKDFRLSSIEVKAYRPIVKTEGSRQTVTVKGTFLSKMGNLGNMLSVTPGIIAKGNNNFDVAGKGKPIYYVDGKEVTNQNIFTTLKTSDIAKIEIEREPSAKYPAGTNAVINIITIKPLKDFIALDVYNTTTVRRKFSENPSFELRMKYGIWNSSIGYDYGAWMSLNKETYYTEIFHPDRTFRSDEANELFMGSHSHDITWNNNFDINKNNTISLAYYFQHEKENDIGNTDMKYSDTEKYNDKNIRRQTIDNRNLHNVTLYYKSKIGQSLLSLGGDYSIISNNSRTDIAEKNKNNDNGNNNFTKTTNKYKIMTLNATYSFNLPFNISSEAGARYYNVNDRYGYLSDSKWQPETLGSNGQKAEDNVTAAYLSLGKKWKKVHLSLGGRYEYSDTKVWINTLSETISNSRHTSFFLPSGTLTVFPWKNLTFQLNYRRSVNRQKYTGLNPYPVYQDSLSYSAGNRDLQPSVNDNISIYAGWKGLYVTAGYTHTRNLIKSVVYNQDPSTDIVCETPINVKRSESFYTMLGYNRRIFSGKLYFSGNLYINFPKYKYIFLNKTIKIHHPFYSGNMNLYYFLNNKITAYTTLTFQSYLEDTNISQRPANNWSAGVQMNMIKDKLTLTLSVSDILHRANYNNIDIRYINTQHGTYGTNDMRGITLSASLSLFNQDITVSSSRNNNDVIDRTRQ